MLVFPIPFLKNGNLIEQKSSYKTLHFTYDALDRLIIVSDGTEEFVYIYDSFHRRIAKSVNRQDFKYYIYVGQREVGLYDPETEELLEYRVLGLGKGAELGASIAIELNNKIYCPLHDHRGNIVCLLDPETGIPQETYRFTAFGESETQSASKPLNNPWGFLSKRQDQETNFVYFSRRYYAPTTGRWVTPDPLGFADGPNMYAYVHNNPLTMVDLYGLYVEDSKGNWSFDGYFPEKEPEKKNFKNFWSDAYSNLREWENCGMSLDGDSLEEQIREVRGNPLFDILEHEFEKRNLIAEMLSDPSNDLTEKELSNMINSQDDFYREYLKDRAIDLGIDVCLRLVSKGKNGISLGSKTSFNPKRPGCKGGPKHRDKIKEVIEQKKALGHAHKGGGNKKEVVIPIDNSEKAYRRGDATFVRPDGIEYHVQVGRQTKAGDPIARERRAKIDIESMGKKVEFVPYNE